MRNYEVKKHPDGQITVKINGRINTLNTRVNSYEDLFILKTINETHKFCKFGNIQKLIIPCLFGQRGDRRFNNNESFDLKIITEFINGIGFEQVSIFDPHSDVSLALINNSEKITSLNIVTKIIDKLNNDFKYFAQTEFSNLVLCSPDAGAYKKVFQYGEYLKTPVVAANKFRNNKNEITLNFLGDINGKDILIVDDLCSRGGTFMELGKQLKEQGAENIYLYVSHFEGGCNEYKQTIDRLNTIFTKVYTTNSYRDFDEDDLNKIEVFDIINN